MDEEINNNCGICGDETDGSQKIGDKVICSKPECMSAQITGETPIPVEETLENPPTIADICTFYECTNKELRAALAAFCVKEPVQEQIEFNRNRSG